MTGSRGTSDGGSQSFSSADVAIETFGKLTGRDFGYQRDASVDARLLAIGKARKWWKKSGRDELKGKIAADHPPVLKVGDLLDSEAESEKRAKALVGSDSATRARVLGELGTVYSWRVQTALVAALSKSGKADERIAILRVLERCRSHWMLPALVGKVEDAKEDLAVRLRAGGLICQVVGDKKSLWLETRDIAKAAARKILQAQGGTHSDEIHWLATSILSMCVQW